LRLFFLEHFGHADFILKKTSPHPTFGSVILRGASPHYLMAGDGPPLVIIQATVSLIIFWLLLMQLMGQRHTAYFFELHGHDQSAPYPNKFESCLVPPTVASFMVQSGMQLLMFYWIIKHLWKF